MMMEQSAAATTTEQTTSYQQKQEMTDEFEFETMPVIDLDLYLRSGNQTEAARAECGKVAECFHRYGILLVKDPRVDMADNEDYIDLMEAYFA